MGPDTLKELLKTDPYYFKSLYESKIVPNSGFNVLLCLLEVGMFTIAELRVASVTPVFGGGGMASHQTGED